MTTVDPIEPDPLSAETPPASVEVDMPEVSVTIDDDLDSAEEPTIIPVIEEEALAEQPTVAPAPQPITETDPLKRPENFDALFSIASLLVGGTIEGVDTLIDRLKTYETELAEEEAEREAAAEATADARAALDPAEGVVETDGDLLRYMLIGMAYDMQRGLGRGISLASKLTANTLNIAHRMSRPFANNSLTRPVQSRIDRLALRGQARVEEWVRFGREAEPHSRALANKTYHELVDELINQMAENPEIQELITQQSLSLAGEVRDEVRERTVTADNVMENLVRRVLRRAPRAELPEPPPEVQAWATKRLGGANTDLEDSSTS